MRAAWMVPSVTAVTLAASGAVAEAKRPSACERLRGADLAPARMIKLVKRDNAARGSDLVACVLPRGRLRRLASSADQETARRGFDVLQVAGSFVLLRSDYVSQNATTNTVAVRNIRSGDSYEIAYMCAPSGAGDCGRGGRSCAALKAVINDRGQAAAAISFAGSGATTISGFSRLGERRDYDSALPADIPTASLQLSASRISWMNAGQTYSEQLPD